ncbi:MAG: sodium:solute symporter family protein [Acidobacteriota bacterium]|nr:sodium:solute symporter family protein [Acidobacteriota bacterium]
MWQPFVVLGLFYGAVVALLYITQQRDRVDFEEYAVGGRRYGPAYIGMSYVQSWFPGAMFVAFVALGVNIGTLMYYCLAYSLLGLTAMYFMANRAWRWGQRHQLRSQPHLLELRYDSSGVKLVASVVGIAAIMPWVILGLQAMAILFEVSSNGAWSLTTCLLLGMAVIVVRQYWTVRMGMRGLIMSDMLQGIVAYLVAALVCVIILADKNSPAPYGNLAHLPEKLTSLPGMEGTGYGPLYVFSLIFMGVIGALAWPMSFQRIYTASGVKSVKSGTVYAIGIAGVFYGFLTIFTLAAATWPKAIEAPNLTWFSALQEYGGVWLLGLGVVMVLGASMGHVDGSIQVAGLQIANDLVHHFKPLKDHQLTIVAKGSMVVYMAIAAILAYVTIEMARLQLLAQMSYYLVIQISVPLFLGLFTKFGNRWGAMMGMIAGSVVAIVLTVEWIDDIPALGGLTAGMVGLIVNFVTYAVVSLLTGQSEEDKKRVDELFLEALPPVKRQALGLDPVVGPVTTMQAEPAVASEGEQP